MLVNFSFVVCFLIHLTLISKTNARILQAKNESIAIYPIDDQYISIPFNYTLNKTGMFSENGHFYMEELAVVFITMDLRNLYMNDTFFQYGQDWTILMKYHLRDGSSNLNVSLIDMPANFLDVNNSKNSAHYFSFIFLSNISFSLKIQIMNLNFSFTMFQFINSTQIQAIKPCRADYPNTKQFFIILDNSLSQNLPINLPISNDSLNYSEQNFIISYIAQTQHINSLFDKNPNFDAIDYWNYQNNPQIAIPYFPYFSNCKGFDLFIPFISLTELHPSCVLVDIGDTIPVYQYDFGGTPRSDTCANILIDCILDESLLSSNIWNSLNTGSVFFKITSDPQKLSDSRNTVFDDSQLVSVQVTSNSINTNMVPTLIRLKIYYHQISPTTKKIITASASFEEFVIPMDSQYEGNTFFHYSLDFSYKPLTHTDLTIMFALNWEVYLILYMGIGFVAIVIVGIFTLYHTLMEKLGIKVMKRKKTIKFKFFWYITMILPNIVEGIGIIIVPMIGFFITSCVLMKGTLMDLPIISFGCDPNITDPNYCPHSIFDFMVDNSLDLVALRSGRCGITLTIGGFYLLLLGTNIFIPKAKTKPVNEVFGNMWSSIFWKKSVFIFVSLNLIIVMIYFIYFTYSNYFGKSLYSFLVLLKVFVILLEEVIGRILKEDLLVSPLSCFMSLIMMLTTYGATDFLSFLNSYLIDTGISLVERPYVCYLKMSTKGFIEEFYKKTIRAIKMKFLREDADEIFEEKKVNKEKIPVFEANKINEINKNIKDNTSPSVKSKTYSIKSKSSAVKISKLAENENKSFSSHKKQGNPEKYEEDSDIVFTDEENKDLSSNQDSFRSNSSSSGSSDVEEDIYEQFLKEIIEEKKIFSKHMKLHKKQNLSKSDIESVIKYTHSTEEAMDMFSNISEDNLALLYFPILLLVLWLYYDESQIGSNYSITKQTFIYYFLFSLTSIPVQLCIDVFFYNLIENYHDFDFTSLLQQAKIRFKNRKTLWARDDTDEDIKLEKGSRSKAQIFMSPQFYFMVTLYMSGLTAVTVGIIIMLANNYNFFRDYYAPFIIIFWVVIFIILENVCIWAGKKFKIWKVSGLKRGKFSEKIMSKMNTCDSHFNCNINEEFPLKTNKPSINQQEWQKVLKIRDKEARLKEILEKLQEDTFLSENFRQRFFKKNSKWISSNFKLIFTPTTTQNYRETILETFENINDKLLIKDTKELDLEEEFNPTTKIILPSVETQIKRQVKFSEVVIEIVKYWLNRANNLKKIRSQIAGLMQFQMIKDRCDFCKSNWGLRSECVDSLEDLFAEFLKKNKYQNAYDISKWQSYFYKNAVLRTICFSCSEEILLNRKSFIKPLIPEYKKRLTLAMKKVSFDEDFNIEWKKKVNKKILKFWLVQAQRSLDMKKNQSISLKMIME